MRILVTGGEGFIGRNIIEYAKNLGWETISVDIAEQTSKANLHVKGSVLNADHFARHLDGVDYVFHEAAVTSPPEFESNPDLGYRTNVLGTYNVLNQSLEHGVKKVIIASSSSLYGGILKQVSEEDADLNFTNIYPMSKYINEVTAKYYALNTGMETVSLRYFNTYGNGENTKGFYSSVVHKFIDDLQNNQNPLIFNDGTQSRDFIYVRDVARANVLAAKYGKNGEAYNIGTGLSRSFNDIYHIIKEEYGSFLLPMYSPVPFSSYQTFTQANIEKAEKDLGFSPEFDIVSGIKEMLRKKFD